MSATFDTVPYLSSRPAWLRALLDGARSATKRLCFLGDSQETSPLGNGIGYQQHFNHQMVLRYGNSPETPFYGGAAFGDHWIASATNADGQANQVSSTRRLHESRGVLSGEFGNVLCCDFDGSRHGYSSLLPRGKYFDPTAGFDVDAFAGTAPGGGDGLNWSYSPRAVATLGYGGAVQTGSFSLGLDSATWQVKKGTIAGLAYDAAKPYCQFEVRGSHATLRSQFLGTRVRSRANHAGIVATMAGIGGYKATDLPTLQPDIGPMLAALGFDLYVIPLGANDASAGYTAAQFKANVVALLAFVRTAVGDPQAKFLLVADPYRGGLTGGQVTEFDQYAGALAEIAESDPYAVAVNSRRALHEAGWNATNENGFAFVGGAGYYWLNATPYVVGSLVWDTAGQKTYRSTSAHTSSGANSPEYDGNAPWTAASLNLDGFGVHYTAVGAKLKAEAEAAILFGGAELMPVNVVQVNGVSAEPVDDLPRNVTVTQRSVVVNDN